MPVASYFPPDHDRPPPVVAKQQLSPPTSPSSKLPRSTLTRSTSEQLSIPNRLERDGDRIAARRRSSALGDLDEAAIRELSARAKEAELRAQWEGRINNRPNVVAPPSTPPRSTRQQSNNLNSPSASSLYQTPTSVARTPTRSPRSPRSRDPSYTSPGGRASSIRSNFSSSTSTSSNLSAVSEFLAEEEPPPSTLLRQRTSSSNQFLSSSRPSSSRSSIRSNRSTSIFPTTNPRSSSLVSHSPRSSFDDDSSEEEEVDEEPHIPISSQFSGPRLVKTTLETDRFVQVLNLEKQQLLQSRQQQQMRGMGNLGNRDRERTKSSSNGEAGTDHSRSESGNSDASFASMTAVGPSGLAPVEEINGRLRLDGESFAGEPRERSGLSSTGMERDDTLRPSTTSSHSIGTGNRWDQLEGGGAAKSIEEIVNGFKALGVGNEVKGIVERRRSSIATLQNLPTRRDASLEEYQYPPTSISTTSSTDNRPLSPDSTSSTMLPYVPFPTPPSSSTVASGGKIKSIEEIIAQHAGTSYLSNNPTRAATPSSTPASTPISASFAGRTRTRELSNISSAGSETSSIGSYNSIQREIRNSTISSSTGRDLPALAFETNPASDTRSTHSSSIRSVSSSLSPPSTSPLPPTPSTASPSSLSSPSSPSSQKLQQQQELSLLLRSPRLTRLIRLSRPSNTSITVSLSDVGSPAGHPVLIFLGLGSVRYILALFEELAEIFGLRLICIDRWGIGKTTTVPDKERGFREWSEVVEEVVEDHLQLSEGYSVLAHSAGSPYGLVNALRSERVKGTVHLLAPWVVGAGENEGVGMSADNLAGMYKYLKFVPSGVLKTAQQAEWKIQGWRLGKSPLLLDEHELNEEESVGTGAVTPRKDKRESSSLASLGIVGSGEVVDKLEKLYPDGGIRLAGPHVNSTPVKGNSTPRRKASLSVNGKSLFGGIFASGGGGSAKSNRSLRSGADDTSSLRPSIASNSTSTGRRSSYYAASAINSPLSESSGRPSGLTTPATPTSASSSRQSSFVPDRSPSPVPPLSSSLTPQRPVSSISMSSASSTNYRPSSPSTLLTPTSPATPTRTSISPSLLISGLLRASHAESLSGSTSDLLVLLDRSNNARNSIDYKQIKQPVKVWYGDKDDRISESSIRWLEKEIRDCKVQIIKGADHNLMTNHQVMFDVLESISKEFNSSR
ncbi:hypothetical protein JCM3765_001282 [Sporobolomyces pararoseus]